MLVATHYLMPHFCYSEIDDLSIEHLVNHYNPLP